VPDDGSFDELSYLRKEVRRLRRSLSLLTPGLDILLKRRGFRIFKKEPAEFLLLPGPELVDEYYTMLGKYSFRLFLRDVIKHQDFFTLEDVTRYATSRVTAGYIKYLTRTGLAGTKGNGYALARHVRSFGETLEWYVSEVLAREFGTEAVWGVKFRRPDVGGDYDVIARFDGSILYAEVKSSPPRQIYENEIAAFLDRVLDLSPEIAIFLMDTELRMKDKIVPMFEGELKRRSAGRTGVRRIEKELFQAGDRIFIINSKDSIVHNIEAVLNRYFRRFDEI
jgi:hypothetical protein